MKWSAYVAVKYFQQCYEFFTVQFSVWFIFKITNDRKDKSEV